MKFGRHQPASTRDRGQQSAMAAFTRGPQVPGKQWSFKFDNGYGASVINDGYGAESGLYELAVLGLDGHLTYETPITNDVLCFLTVEEVAAALDQIEALTEESIAAAKVEKRRAELRETIADAAKELASLEDAEVTA